LTWLHIGPYRAQDRAPQADFQNITKFTDAFFRQKKNFTQEKQTKLLLKISFLNKLTIHN
jgi:hypothetical protein